MSNIIRDYLNISCDNIEFILEADITKYYAIELDASCQSIEILANPTKTGCTLKGDTGVKELKTGVNTFVVEVIEEDQTTHIFNISVVCKQTKKSEKIKAVKVNGNNISYDFDAKAYTVEINEDIDTVFVEVETDNNSDRITGDIGDITIEEGQNPLVCSIEFASTKNKQIIDLLIVKNADDNQTKLFDSESFTEQENVADDEDDEVFNFQFGDIDTSALFGNNAGVNAGFSTPTLDTGEELEVSDEPLFGIENEDTENTLFNLLDEESDTQEETLFNNQDEVIEEPETVIEETIPVAEETTPVVEPKKEVSKPIFKDIIAVGISAKYLLASDSDSIKEMVENDSTNFDQIQMQPAFSPEITEYHINVYDNIKGIYFILQAENKTHLYKNGDFKSVIIGMNSFEFTIYDPENQVTNIYKCTVACQPAPVKEEVIEEPVIEIIEPQVEEEVVYDARINNMYIPGTRLQPPFSPEIKDYKILIQDKKEAKKAKLHVLPINKDTDIVYPQEVLNINTLNDKITITTTHGTDKCTYTLEVEKEVAPVKEKKEIDWSKYFSPSVVNLIEKRKNTVVKTSNYNAIDFKLVGILLLLMVGVYVIFNFAFTPMKDKYDMLSSDYELLEIRANDIANKLEKEDEYLAEIEEFEKLEETLLTRYPAVAPQQESLLTTQDISDATGIDIENITIGAPTEVDLFYFQAKIQEKGLQSLLDTEALVEGVTATTETTETTTEDTTQTTETTETTEGSEVTKTESQYFRVLSQNISITGTKSQITSLYESLYGDQRSVYIDNVSWARETDDGSTKYTMSFTVDYYQYIGE